MGFVISSHERWEQQWLINNWKNENGLIQPAQSHYAKDKSCIEPLAIKLSSIFNAVAGSRIRESTLTNWRGSQEGVGDTGAESESRVCRAEGKANHFTKR